MKPTRFWGVFFMLAGLLAGCAAPGGNVGLGSPTYPSGGVAAPSIAAQVVTPSSPVIGSSATGAGAVRPSQDVGAVPPRRTSTPSPLWQITALGGGLSLAEFRAAAEKEDTPDHFEFNNHIPLEVFSERVELRSWAHTLERTVAEANRVMAPFGWQIQTVLLSPLAGVWPDLRLLHEGQEVKMLQHVWPVAASASGQDFALVVEEGAPAYSQWLLTKGGLERWDDRQHAYITHPVFAGEMLVTAGHEPDNWVTAVVWAGERTYRIPVDPARIGTSDPIKSLGSYAGQWVLEVQGQLVIDGQGMNQKLGCEQIFSWQLLQGQPFYFCQQGGAVTPWYAGQALPVHYAGVIHDRCCEPAAFNVVGNGQMIWFYARRDGGWYYVEIY